MTCFWFHKWTRWRDVEEGGLGRRDKDGNLRVIGRFLVQERNCQTCGKRELREERI